jgi:hypothetical protein
MMLTAAIVLSSCSEDGDSVTAPSTSEAATTAAPSTSPPPPPTTASTTTAPGTATTGVRPENTTTTTLPPPQGPLQPRGGEYRIRWGKLAVQPGYTFVDDDADNPFWLIHTDAERDGFAFSLELYTTGYGEQWEGETGTFAIACTEPPPGEDSTGICPHLDPDGPGPQPDIVGFAADGQVTIDRLDEQGYDITIDELTMAFGVSIRPFRLRGTAPG